MNKIIEERIKGFINNPETIPSSSEPEFKKITFRELLEEYSCPEEEDGGINRDISVDHVIAIKKAIRENRNALLEAGQMPILINFFTKSLFDGNHRGEAVKELIEENEKFADYEVRVMICKNAQELFADPDVVREGDFQKIYDQIMLKEWKITRRVNNNRKNWRSSDYRCQGTKCPDEKIRKEYIMYEEFINQMNDYIGIKTECCADYILFGSKKNKERSSDSGEFPMSESNYASGLNVIQFGIDVKEALLRGIKNNIRPYNLATVAMSATDKATGYSSYWRAMRYVYTTKSEKDRKKFISYLENSYPEVEKKGSDFVSLRVDGVKSYDALKPIIDTYLGRIQ